MTQSGHRLPFCRGGIVRELLVAHPDFTDDVEIRPVGLEHEKFPHMDCWPSTMFEMLRSWVIITKFEGSRCFRTTRLISNRENFEQAMVFFPSCDWHAPTLAISRHLSVAALMKVNFHRLHFRMTAFD
jgi:hypothetical protein